MNRQNFIITLKLTTECNETISTAEIIYWLNKQFKECDFGKIDVTSISEETCKHKNTAKEKVDNTID